MPSPYMFYVYDKAAKSKTKVNRIKQNIVRYIYNII